MSAATSTDSAAVFTISPPLQVESEADNTYRPPTPAMATVTSSSKGAEQTGRVSSAEDTIYTPATTTSSRSSSVDDTRPQPSERHNAVWSDWWMAEELASQVGSLSKELAELKEMMSKQRPREEGSGDGRDDLSRLKSDHRSSLASLADSHRTEIANMVSAHKEEVMKLELQHATELRNARRNNEVDHVLVKGLHESYARQIENLVLDLNEFKQENKELRLKCALAASAGPSSNEAIVSDQPTLKTLSLSLTFNDLDDALSSVEFSIPHPGQSFSLLSNSLSLTVKNYFQALNAATEFFSTTKGIVEGIRIRHWHQSAVEGKINFIFPHQNHANYASARESWECERWKDESILMVICATDAIGNVSVFTTDERDDDTVINKSSETFRPAPERMAEPPVQPLVSVETTSEDPFNPAAELERINRELSQLQVSSELQRQLEEQTTGQSQNIKEQAEKRKMPQKVTVESVKDIDDPPTPPHSERPPIKRDEAADCALPFSLRKQNHMDVWAHQVSVENTETGKGASVVEQNGTKESQGPKSSDSWLFDEIFSPLPADQVEKTRALEVIDEDDSEDREISGYRRPSSGNPFATVAGFRDDNSVSLTGDGPFKTPPTGIMSESQLHCQRNQYWEEVPRESFLERLRQEELEEDERVRGIEQQHSKLARDRTAERMTAQPLFRATDKSIPSSPLVSEPKGKSPASPARVPTGSEAAGQRSHLNSLAGDDQRDDMTEQENPFADLKSEHCDSPVLDASRSVVSTTPLLDDDATGRKAGISPPAPIAPLGEKNRGFPPPFPPLSGSTKRSFDQQSPHSSAGFRRYTFRNVSDRNVPPSASAPWESGSNATIENIENYDSGSVLGHKKCGHGQGHEAYTWRRSDDGLRSRTASPSPSRSSTTTSDRNSGSGMPSLYHQNFQSNYTGNIGNGNGSNFGSFRYGPHPMGPLGPQSAFNPQQAEFFMQQMKRMHDIAAANFSGHRPSIAPSFGGGPVFAPNPPHSVAPFNENGLSSNFMNGDPTATPSRLQYENAPWMVRSPPGLPGPPPPVWNATAFEPRRSYSTDSISPLLWKTDDGAQPGAVIPAHHPMQPSGPPNGALDVQHNYPTPLPGLGTWAPVGANFGGMPGTPGSHAGVHGRPHPPPNWYQQHQMPPFEAPWGGVSGPMFGWH